MRVLCKCVECGNWFQYETVTNLPEHVEATVARYPTIFDHLRCQFCASLLVANDTHFFFEEFEGISSYGITLDIDPSVRCGPVECPPVKEYTFSFISGVCADCGRVLREVRSTGEGWERSDMVCEVHGVVSHWLRCDTGELDLGVIE